MFRLEQDQALINRMGLNNIGAEAVVRNLDSQQLKIPVGVNIVKTNLPGILDEQAIEDFVACYEIIEKVADYISLNVSCPNTGDGKTFEEPESLSALLEEINKIKVKINSRVPIFVKFSSDMELTKLEQAIEVCEAKDISGYVLVNTSLRREGLVSEAKSEKGGLSGKPIREIAKDKVKFAYKMLAGKSR